MHISEQKIYTDQTGRFPVISSLENKYFLVLYVAYTNTILAEPLRENHKSTYYKIKKSILVSCRQGFHPQGAVLGQRAPETTHRTLREKGHQVHVGATSPSSRRRRQAHDINFKAHWIWGCLRVTRTSRCTFGIG